ncbi:hypothetical protein DY000_02055215 [Brassica cretica]|uniref:Uncharacterized protein n=1 Tax=Brassica cretica TaxID=69181 RepID=A0ABQ7AHT9_BRACR|nr:hypothetical protein DY000_02055215 [Brassica cretica]
MSSSNYFRFWIDRPHLDPNTRLLTEEYQRGITEFMGLVHRQPEAKTGFISSEIPDENSEEHFVGTSEENSEEVLPRYIPSLGIFRGVFRRTGGPRSFLGNLFPRNSVGKFRGISEEK